MFSKRKYLFAIHTKPIQTKNSFTYNDNSNQYLNLSKLSQISTTSKSPNHNIIPSFQPKITCSSVKNVSQFLNCQNSSRSLFSLKKKKLIDQKTTNNINNMHSFNQKASTNRLNKKSTNKIFMEISEEISYHKDLSKNKNKKRTLNTSFKSNNSNYINTSNTSFLSKCSNYNNSHSSISSTVDTKRKFDFKALRNRKINNIKSINDILSSSQKRISKSVNTKRNNNSISRYDSSLCVIERQFKKRLQKPSTVQKDSSQIVSNELPTGPEDIHIRFVQLHKESKMFYQALGNRIKGEIDKKEFNDNTQYDMVKEYNDIEYCEEDIYFD